MPQTNIGSSVASNLANAMTAYSVDAVDTDAAQDQKETTYQNSNWSRNLGYYKAIPELSSAIDALATWSVGKGYKADPETMIILDSIIGWGKDTYNTILENMIRTYYIGGDAYCEVIRDEDGELINLKPLDTGAMKIVVDDKGIIKRYEQISKTKNVPKNFKPEEIFHLARNRVADEIHGVSIIDNLQNIILMRNEAMTDMQEVFHRYIHPKNIFKLDTDNVAEIAAFKAKMDASTGAGENMYIPMGAVEVESMSIPPNSTLNPLPWINDLNKYFYQATRVPEIIVGSSSEMTEASAKIAYLAFQQTIEEEQLFIEEQTGIQLGIEIELEFPASLENELLSDKAKDGNTPIQPNETTAGRGQ